MKQTLLIQLQVILTLREEFNSKIEIIDIITSIEKLRKSVEEMKRPQVYRDDLPYSNPGQQIPEEKSKHRNDEENEKQNEDSNVELNENLPMKDNLAYPDIHPFPKCFELNKSMKTKNYKKMEYNKLEKLTARSQNRLFKG